MKVINCIPKDKIDWAPKEGKMTFGDIIRHIALAERFIFVEIAKNNKNMYPGFDQIPVKSYDDLLEYLMLTHNESINILNSIPDSELTKKILTPDGIQMTMWKWLRAMVEHEIHHRGTIYSNLSLLDIKTPPIFGLEEREVRKN
jgi:uncharacterized damage-inducible protein DinB